jgi:hypothetical protein
MSLPPSGARSSREPSRYIGPLACAIGVAGIGAFLLIPTYSSASATSMAPGDDLASPNPPILGVGAVTSESVLQVGVAPQTTAVLVFVVVLFAIVALGPFIAAHRQRPILLGSAVLCLFGMTILGGFTIGIFLAPGVLMAFVTFIVTLTEPEGTGAASRSS